jgi:hypothetical protein
MDVAQVIDLIGVLKEQYGFDIMDESKEDICSQIAAIALGAKIERGPKTINVIGSTNAVAAYVFELEQAHHFAAVPHNDKHMTVTEIVTEAKVMVRQGSKNKKENSSNETRDLQITLSVMPWTINASAEEDMTLVLRFHSFGMDAKAEMVHNIYQEIVIALGTNREDAKYFQIIPRTAFIETAHVEVMDVVVSDEIHVNIANIHVHFTGNADGGIRRVEFGGIDATVLAGSKTIELGYKRHDQQRIYWAAMHEIEIVDTRYIVHLLIAGGNRVEDMISVIFAKPEHVIVRKNISNAIEKKVNAKRALQDEKCTIIFASNHALHKFVYYFKKVEVWSAWPQAQIGFMNEGIIQAMEPMGEQLDYMTQSQYKSAFRLFQYRSNEASAKQTELLASKGQAVEPCVIPIECKCQHAIAILKRGKEEMDEEEFKKVINELCNDMNLQVRQHHDHVDTNKRGAEAMDMDEREGQKESPQSGGNNGKNGAKAERQLRRQNKDMEVDK